MLAVVGSSTPLRFPPPNSAISISGKIKPRTPPNSATVLNNTPSSLPLSLTFYRPFSALIASVSTPTSQFSPRAASASSSVGSPEYTVEPATNVKFQKLLSLPGCSSPLSLLGTGYREKVFAIIGVKIYAAGLYMNQSVLDRLDAWKGQSPQEIQRDSSLFDSIFQAPLEKSLQIVLVRDVDGKTFWDALDAAISPRFKSPTPADESALSTFRRIFQGRPLKKGTFIFLIWQDPTKMLVAVSSDGLPSAADATVESSNVTSALFDVFFGSDPVSPSLKSSAVNGLVAMLK